MELLTVTDIAERYDVATSTVRRWCQRGLMPGAKRISRMWLVPVDALENFERPPMGRPPKEDSED